MSQTTATPPSPGPCTLFVTLVGFDPAAARRLATLLDDCSALGARWRVRASGTCDLWIVNGERARSLGQGLIEVDGEPPVRVRPAEMPHPVAFTEPLDEGVSTGHRFDPASMHSLNVLLTRLGRWLTPCLVRQALVAQLISNGASFTRSNVIEVRHGRRLLAVIDFSGETAVAADATAAEVRSADWVLRERGASFVPPGFRTASTEQVLWHYANRSDAAPLPGRYARLPIHLRRIPALPPRELSDTQLQLLRELAYAPQALPDLLQRTGADAAALKRDLAALYLVGAITCDPGRSRSAREHKRGARPQAGEDLSFVGARPSSLGELTAPGLFRGRAALAG